MFKQVYNWIMSWSESAYGSVSLFFLAFTSSFLLPIPVDILFLPLCLGQPQTAFRFAVIGTVGSVLGGVAGYSIG